MYNLYFLSSLQLPVHRRDWKATKGTAASTSEVSVGFPSAEHFNVASHSLDDIMVCAGLKTVHSRAFLGVTSGCSP